MKTVNIFTKGLAKDNPGQAAIGVVIADNAGKILKEVAEGIGNATNDYAEYFAVVRGLQEVVELFGEKTHQMEFELRLENELVKNHMCAKEQIKDVSLIGHFIEIYNTRVASFPNLEIVQVAVEENDNARRLVNKALDVA